MTLLTTGDALLDEARQASAGRAARTLHSGSHLRQTLIALAAGTRMNEHQSPGDATVLCLRGHVTLHTSVQAVPVAEGELVDVPPARHDAVADDESLLLLTVAIG